MTGALFFFVIFLGCINGMAFKIVRNDITKVSADILVNSANTKPICAGYRTDAAIYEAAGFGIAEECSANFVNDREAVRKCCGRCKESRSPIIEGFLAATVIFHIFLYGL